MPPHTDSHLLHSALRALQMPGDALYPGDAVYKGAILAAALLLLLTAVV